MLLPLLIGGAGMVWYQNHDRHRAEGYLAARVEPGDIEDTVSALGTLQPVQYVDVDVGTQVTGQLKSFLDEPTSAVDPASASMIHDAIDRVQAGKTVLMISHQISPDSDFDQILTLRDRKICVSAPPEYRIRLGGTT
jgi:ABC-type phosphate/phosphonate transport system ATPase subunit